jgi:hypothetical protein
MEFLAECQINLMQFILVHFSAGILSDVSSCPSHKLAIFEHTNPSAILPTLSGGSDAAAATWRIGERDDPHKGSVRKTAD